MSLRDHTKNEETQILIRFGKLNAFAKGETAINALKEVAKLYRPLVFLAILLTLPIGLLFWVMMKIVLAFVHH